LNEYGADVFSFRTLSLISYLVLIYNKVVLKKYEYYAPPKLLYNLRFHRLLSFVSSAPRKNRNETQQRRTSPSPEKASSLCSKPSGGNKMAPKDAGMNYDPTKHGYHPIDDACWSRGDK
jgi:hypothetical protein